jgi:glycosyltransferase involved in cell wall biosynthesis
MSVVLSIITVNLNNASGLQNTLQSIAQQSFDAFEHWVIDGNSSDTSMEVLKSFNYPQLNYISEPDTGIYNAMNKGVTKASGKYLLFLNSGDRLENDEVLSTVKPYLNEDYSILSGNIIFDEGKTYRLREHPDELTFSYLVGNAISHPSTFIKSTLFDTYGLYREDLKIVSDWAFFLLVLGIHNESYHKIPEVITVFDTHGISTVKDNFDSVYAERHQVLELYFPRVYNNEKDRYIFNKFTAFDKRSRYLMTVEEYPLLRKLITVVLFIFASFIKFFKRSK